MRLEPLNDRVTVRRHEEEKQTPGGIVLPGSATEKPNAGVVVEVGPGRLLDDGSYHPPQVKKGDKVVFGPYSGSSTVSVGGEELLVMSESEIFGILRD